MAAGLNAWETAMYVREIPAMKIDKLQTGVLHANCYLLSLLLTLKNK